MALGDGSGGLLLHGLSWRGGADACLVGGGRSIGRSFNRREQEARSGPRGMRPGMRVGAGILTGRRGGGAPLCVSLAGWV
ncbi:hypothetical protein PT2222_80170 [Paraburkholderia tropica]